MNAELAQMLEALHADAFGWALYCCRGQATQAEDVLQNAYLKLAQNPDSQSARPSSFEGRSSFKSWWFGVIRLTAMEDHRRQTSRDSLLNRVWSWLANQPTSTVSLPAKQMELDEQSDLLRRHLQSLSPRQAEVLHLVFYQELTIRESADVMGVGLGSARQHYERGKLRLRELLKSEVCDVK